MTTAQGNFPCRFGFHFNSMTLEGVHFFRRDYMLTIKTWQDVLDLYSAKTIPKSLVEHVEGLTICASWPFWIRLCLKAKACAT
jgi:hypothetical protein